MADDYVQVAEDGAGKQLQTFSNTIESETRHAQASVIVKSDGTAIDPGQTTMAASLPVTIASNQSAVPVSFTMPALVAGTANIGDVDVLSLPSIPAGTNNIGDVDVLTLPALVAGTANIGDVDVLTLPALVAGSAVIGKVGIDQTTPGTTNLVALTAETTKVIGTINLSAAQTLATVTTVATVTSLSQFAGQAIALNAGSVSAGTLRVAIARPATAFCVMIPSQVHVAGANTVHWDLFNAHASLIVRVVSIRQIPNITTAVTGIVFDWLLERTTAVGTGGSALTPWEADTGDTDLDVAITVRSKPTGGATAGIDLFNYSLSSEETLAATIQIASQGGLELVPVHLQPDFGGKGIVLRQNQGIRDVQVNSSNAGNTAWLISFTVE